MLLVVLGTVQMSNGIQAYFLCNIIANTEDKV